MLRKLTLWKDLGIYDIQNVWYVYDMGVHQDLLVPRQQSCVHLRHHQLSRPDRQL